MPRVLITAFAPFDRWTENASWLALVELTKDLSGSPQVTTRRYPVDFAEMPELLAEDLADDYDVALHLGQNAGAVGLELEMVGLNLAADKRGEEPRPLVIDGPPAHISTLPLYEWAGQIRRAGVPAKVSHHAGLYLCNAALYLSHHLSQQQGRKTQSAFVHLPLTPAQACNEPKPSPSMSSSVVAGAVRVILDAIVSAKALA